MWDAFSGASSLNTTGFTGTYAANLGATLHALRAARHQGTIVLLNLDAPTGQRLC